MPRAALVLLLAICLGAADAGVLVDRPVRYVNQHVITIGDIRSRNGIRVELFRRAGRVLPEDRAGILAFNRSTLEELTDEQLLVQKAEELKVPIDRDRLASDAIAEARERGLGLREIAVLRRFREREAKVDAVLGWFEGRTANTSPEELQRSYRERTAEFTRPARARTVLHALRATGPDERRDLVRSMAQLMRELQQSDVPALRDPAAAQLDPFLAADQAGQERILAEVARAAAAQAGAEGLGKPGQELAARAGRLATAWAGVRTRDECEAALNALRERLLALPVAERAAALQAEARASSQGPMAADGGLLGWVEPGTFGNEIEEQALAMPVGEPSGPFQTGGMSAIVLILEREEGRVQSFAEVSAALQASLDRQRREAVRGRVTTVLRAQASVTDVIDLGELIR
jgi:hypothetical protein